jgi:pSer/pThr/pTyr-binding forkhead associated (FHA) protein
MPRQVVVRIGIHMGEVYIKRDQATSLIRDILGMQVDVAHRIMSLAGGNQTLVTSSVFDNARAVLRGEELNDFHPVLWKNHGPYRIKGLEEPWDVCEVGEKGLAPLSPPADSEKAKRYISPDSEPVSQIPHPEKRWSSQAEHAALSPLLFLEAGFDIIALVLKAECSFGRQMQNADIEIPILDPKTKQRARDKVEKISRCHFHIKYTDKKVYIVDSSSHGTYVNGTRILKSGHHPLQNNDRIQLVKEHDTWAISYTYREFKSALTGTINAIRLQQLLHVSPRAIILLIQEATIGSTEEDIIYFPLPGVKPEHARLLRKDNQLWIEPLHGAVMVNNHPVDKNEFRQLSNGCEINLAGQIIKINPQQTRFWKTMETGTVTQ